MLRILVLCVIIASIQVNIGHLLFYLITNYPTTQIIFHIRLKDIIFQPTNLIILKFLKQIWRPYPLTDSKQQFLKIMNLWVQKGILDTREEQKVLNVMALTSSLSSKRQRKTKWERRRHFREIYVRVWRPIDLKNPP